MRLGSGSGVRLAEVVASLSLATDLGLGQPQEHVLRQTVLAMRVADAAGLGAEERAATFYVSLLAWVGCVADSHELARWFGDDTAIRAASYEVDRAGIPMLRFLLGHLELDGSPIARAATMGRFLTGGMRDVMASMAAHCETTGQIADRLGIAGQVRRALPQVLERWDGKGGPAGLRGDQIERVMRVAQIASEAEVLHRLGGEAAALTMLRDRRASQFDPALVDLCLANADHLFGDLDQADTWALVIEGCAALDRPLDPTEVLAALETLADYADLKSPWFLGHSRATAAIGSEAARLAHLPPDQVELVRAGGLTSRLGTIGVSSGTWDRPGPLSAAEWERVRTVPYLTERVLRRVAPLAEVAALAGMVHERMDGSGYPRGMSGAAIPVPARILAAADVYRALIEARPHRPAFSRATAASQLLAEARAGRLDGSAVDAVLGAAGHRTRQRPTLVGGLTAREVEVLALLVRGRSNRQIADALFITAKTAGSHIEHIYTKLGVTTRGSAAMFALRHGLVDPLPSEAELMADPGNRVITR